MSLIQTCDPYVWIEEQRAGYVRYRMVSESNNPDATTTRRWEVYGTCDNRGLCWQGAVGPKPTLDCPVTPEFNGCCPFTFVELPLA